MTKKITVNSLKQMKSSGEKIACLTSYDASFARLQDEAGVDLLLVGDSLGMVLHGEETTLNVTMTDMIYHTRLVSSVCQRAIVVSDMPVNSYINPEQALTNARRLVKEGGAVFVKLERGSRSICEVVQYIVSHDIPVCGHLGLTPQSIEELGGYKVQGRTPAAAKQIKLEALSLQEAGVSMLVLECVPLSLASSITSELDIPVIGIGAGADCDGQVLVIYDLLGLSHKLPYMAKNFLAESDNIRDAIVAYVKAVKSCSFPDNRHSFK